MKITILYPISLNNFEIRTLVAFSGEVVHVQDVSGKDGGPPTHVLLVLKLHILEGRKNKFVLKSHLENAVIVHLLLHKFFVQFPVVTKPKNSYKYRWIVNTFSKTASIAFDLI